MDLHNKRPRPPKDFLAFLSAPQTQKAMRAGGFPPPLIVGGQAVNIWATLYLLNESGDTEQFVSKDMDIFGNRETLQVIADAIGAKATVFSGESASNQVGYILPKDDSGEEFYIEVLRGVYGVADDKMTKNASEIEIHGARIRVPSPVDLLEAKIANAYGLDQKDRQDENQLRLLARLMPHHVAKTIAERDPSKERDVVDALERLVTVLQSDRAKVVLRRLGIDPRSFFGDPDAAELNDKIAGFYIKRLPRLKW